MVNALINEIKLENSALVYHPDNISKIKDEDLSVRISNSQFLELLLMKIRGETVKYGARMKRIKNEKEMQLLSDIENLEKVESIYNVNLLEVKQRELQELREEKLKGAFIRSRVQWLNEGEKPSRYFCSLERRNYLEKTIKRITKENGQICKDQKEILSEIKDYYKKLFKNNDDLLMEPDLNDNSFKNTARKLSPNESSEIEGPLTITEISESLKNMKSGKCPGIDGFPSEFFKVFWLKLKYFVLKSLNEAYENKEMSLTLRQCVINCLPKGDKPRHIINNWRPISLLSVIYKIGSSAIANRLRKVLGKIISTNQSGFVSGRYIGDNTRLIYDLLYITQRKDIPGLLMLVDFAKAFDSVSWKFMYSVLNFFGFGPSIIRWVQTFNTNIKATVLQSGFLSDFINVEKGCRQGDPIAAYLFIICAEILLLMIINNDSISGIKIGNTMHKITQFADDTTIILDGASVSLLAALNTLEVYGSYSGLKINTDKTKLIWIGKKRYSKDKIECEKDLDWGTTKFDLLGITFTVDLCKIPSMNYSKAEIKIKNELKKWEVRYLTPIGKITVLKTLIIPKLNHLFLTLPSPSPGFIKNLNDICYKFVWDNKPDKINRKQLCASKLEGGLKMIDIESFIRGLKASWIRNLIIKASAPWAQLAKEIVGDINKVILFGSSWGCQMAKQISNEFWKDVLSAWSSVLLNMYRKCSNLEQMYLPLWYNPETTHSSLYIPELYQRGVLFPVDLVNNGNIMTRENIAMYYNISLDFLTYHRLFLCLKNFFQTRKLKTNIIQRPIFPTQIKLLSKSKKGTKDFYNILLPVNIQGNNFKQKWEANLNLTLNLLTWKNIYKICFYTIKDNFLIWFQYKVIYRLTGTNLLLYKIKQSDTAACRLCGMEEETFLHLFVSCPKSNEFWKNIKYWISQKLNKDFCCIPSHLIFGSWEDVSLDTLVNVVIITGKYYIFKCARLHRALNLLKFEIYLRNVYNEQLMLAKTEMCLERFLRKWSLLTMLLG